MRVLNLSGQSDQQVLGPAVPQRRTASMPKVASLLFEVEELDDRPRAASFSEPTPAMRTLVGVLDFHSELETLVLEEWEHLGAGADVSAQLAELAYRLLPRCKAVVQSSQGGTAGGGAASLRSLRHTWLSCTGGRGERFIFDPQWSEQWEVLNPSEGYSRLLACMPAAFCGSEQRLVAAVQLLSRELEAEFAAKGLSLPPWRSLQATLSKWRPAAPAQPQERRASLPASWMAPAPHAVPRRVSAGFSTAGGCTASISVPASARSSKVEGAAPEGRTLYSRMADGFQRANRGCMSNLLSNGL